MIKLLDGGTILCAVPTVLILITEILWDAPEFLNLPVPPEISNAMIKRPEDNKTRNYVMMRRIMDYGMGVLIMGFGVFFIFAEKFGINFNIGSFFKYFFACLCIVYGAFRIYRGYQSNYFRE